MALKITMKQKALAHYDRMIKWAQGQNPDDTVWISKMRNNINELWFGEDCVYCLKNEKRDYDDCGHCKLKGMDGCCSGLWKEINYCMTWGEWIIAAERVRNYIKENG